jgi:hypothetical protein
VLGVENVLHGVELGGQLGKMRNVGSLAAGGQRLAAGVEAASLNCLPEVMRKSSSSWALR